MLTFSLYNLNYLALYYTGAVSYTHLDVYKRQGLSTSLAAIVKCLERALGPEVEPYTIVFVDDNLVVSKTLDEHIEPLSTIFHKFRQANISLNLDKYEFLSLIHI